MCVVGLGWEGLGWGVDGGVVHSSLCLTVCVCVRACVRACVRVCVCARARACARACDADCISYDHFDTENHSLFHLNMQLFQTQL